jgi:hypothetical protein
MNLETLKNKSILLLGKSRAFSSAEIEAQLAFHTITLLKEYSDEVVVVVEGKMMTPYEQNESDALYERQSAEFITIDNLERELACAMDEDTLLMSLKLSHDKERLKSFLQNTMISDTLFLKLLKMYAWSGEDFFENNDNRDVSAALIVRFYENIERNHNVQYATLGLMHLISQCKDASLIEAISSLEPLQKSLKSSEKNANSSLVRAIATHHLTPSSVLKTFVKNSNSSIRMIIAMRADCDAALQKKLYEDEEMVKEALSHNPNLDKNIATQLLVNAKYAKNIAKEIRLSDALFDILFATHPQELAQNASITFEMQKRVMDMNEVDIKIALACNVHIDENIVTKLVCDENEAVRCAIYGNPATKANDLEEAYKEIQNHSALSCNENTPKEILTKLASSRDIKVLECLAKNPNTPIEILYQLQLDGRLGRYVKENPAFGEHIVTENIGWLI